MFQTHQETLQTRKSLTFFVGKFFSCQHLVLLAIIIPALVFTACQRKVMDTATFGKVVTASGVDSSNAPTALSDTFSPQQKTIYVVAEAKEIAAGTRLSANWSREGTVIQVSDELVATQGYHNSNIEFHLNPGADGFLPGNYKVQLIVNGKPGPDAAFTVK